jgi:endoglucanase
MNYAEKSIICMVMVTLIFSSALAAGEQQKSFFDSFIEFIQNIFQPKIVEKHVAQDVSEEITPMSTSSKTKGWHTDGAKIIDPDGNEVKLKSVSWFGFETANYVVHGLWSRNMEDMLGEIADLGFNSIRVPFSNDVLKDGTKPNSIDFSKNPNLKDKTALEALDYFIEAAEDEGLYIILDRHRPTASGQSELWYTDDVSEDKWISDWKTLAERYKDQENVIAFDLHNEPHGSATWGDNDDKTDWKAAAERAGNKILEENSNVLIIVEGIQYDKNNNAYWWGGTLDQIKDKPVDLDVSNKVVYSPHDYGPGVYNQVWFSDSDFPGNMPGIWDKKWGYISNDDIAPIWIGEFGGKETGTDTNEGKWQNKLVDYIDDNGLNFAYWCWNPNSGDTGGILNDDWTTLDDSKVDMLKKILGETNATEEPNEPEENQTEPNQGNNQSQPGNQSNNEQQNETTCFMPDFTFEFIGETSSKIKVKLENNGELSYWTNLKFEGDVETQSIYLENFDGEHEFEITPVESSGNVKAVLSYSYRCHVETQYSEWDDYKRGEKQLSADYTFSGFEEPNGPEEPGQPNEPNEPGQPNKPNEPGQPGEPDQPGEPSEPNYGDDSISITAIDVKDYYDNDLLNENLGIKVCVKNEGSNKLQNVGGTADVDGTGVSITSSYVWFGDIAAGATVCTGESALTFITTDSFDGNVELIITFKYIKNNEWGTELTTEANYETSLD